MSAAEAANALFDDLKRHEEVLAHLERQSEEIKELRKRADLSSKAYNIVRVFYEQIDDSDCYVCSVINESLVTDKVFRNNINIFVVLIVSTVLVFSLYITISRRMILPITEVVQGMRRVQAGDLDVSVEVYTGDEMEYLAEGFNSMVESLFPHQPFHSGSVKGKQN